jgi:predicted membrane-bound dolichyl-phosphate-mannose-protein mannosyltransferase
MHSDKRTDCVLIGYHIKHEDHVLRYLTSKHFKSREGVVGYEIWRVEYIISNEVAILTSKSEVETTPNDVSRDEKTAKALMETFKLQTWLI